MGNGDRLAGMDRNCRAVQRRQGGAAVDAIHELVHAIGLIAFAGHDFHGADQAQGTSFAHQGMFGQFSCCEDSGCGMEDFVKIKYLSMGGFNA